MKKTILFFFAFTSSLCVFAQEGIFTFYTVNDGLAQSTVTHIYKDTFGYLWIGTGGGLSLFNGYEFRNFKSSINDSLTISNNRIRSFQPSADGKNIWAGTEDGMNCFSLKDGRLIKKICPPGYSGMTSQPLFFNDTAYWFSVASKGFFRKSYHAKEAKQILNTTFRFQVNPLHEHGEFLFQTAEKELILLSVITGKSRTYELPAGLRKKDIYSCIETTRGSVILCTENGLWLMEIKSGKISRYPFGDKNWNDAGKKINAACVDNKGRIWIAVRSEGLFVYDPVAEKVRLAGWEQSGLSVQDKLKNIMCLTADPYGIVWAGTDGHGLVKIITDRVFWGEQYLSPTVTDTCHWFTRSFYRDKNLLWVGTFREGIKIIDYTTGSIKTIFPGFQNGNKENSITAILPAPGNALFIGTTSGLFLLDTITLKLKLLKCKGEESGQDCFVNCMLRCRNGNVFAGTKGCLFRVAGAGGEIFLEKCFAKKINISALAENDNGDLILSAVYLGLFSLDRNGVLKDVFLFSHGNLLPGSTLINGFARNGGRDWYISSNAGLLVFSNDFKFIKAFTCTDGLPDNMLYGIVALPDHRYFISTGKGISIFNPQKKSFENYSEEDGMKSNECNTGALYFSPDATIYAGGVNGFDSRKFPFSREKIIEPEIYFENQFAPGYVADQGKEGSYLYELSYRDNTFALKLWQTDFTFSDRTSYHYQLNGFDPNEVSGTDNRFARYVDVNPGEYNFVSAVSFPGYASPGKVSLFSVKIIPPYWQSAWFRVGSILFILSVIAFIIYFIIRSKYKKQMRKLEMQRGLERVRIRISGDIHDDIGAGLTRIALTSDLVSRQLKQDNPLKLRVANIADSARYLSQSLKEVVWSVKPEYDQLGSMVNYFKGYCGELFEDTDFIFSFHTAGVLSQETVSPEIRRNLFLILKEACNNAIKHSGATKIEARFNYDRGKIYLEITDNGCGIGEIKDDEMNCSGMKNMEKRALDLGFQFKVSGNGYGGCSVAVSGMIS